MQPNTKNSTPRQESNQAPNLNPIIDQSANPKLHQFYSHSRQTPSIMLTLTSVLQSLKNFVDQEFICIICLCHFTNTQINPECNHRFCKDCIKQSLHKCNNECPTCRVHIPTYRSCRDDPYVDRLVSSNSILMCVYCTLYDVV